MDFVWAHMNEYGFYMDIYGSICDSFNKNRLHICPYMEAYVIPYLKKSFMYGQIWKYLGKYGSIWENMEFILSPKKKNISTYNVHNMRRHKICCN